MSGVPGSGIGQQTLAAQMVFRKVMGGRSTGVRKVRATTRADRRAIGATRVHIRGRIKRAGRGKRRGMGYKAARMVKGSAAAKRHMAKLRRMIKRRR